MSISTAAVASTASLECVATLRLGASDEDNDSSRPKRSTKPSGAQDGHGVRGPGGCEVQPRPELEDPRHLAGLPRVLLDEGAQAEAGRVERLPQAVGHARVVEHGLGAGTVVHRDVVADLLRTATAQRSAAGNGRQARGAPS